MLGTRFVPHACSCRSGSIRLQLHSQGIAAMERVLQTRVKQSRSHRENTLHTLFLHMLVLKQTLTLNKFL